MGEDGARDKDWLRAQGHHLCLTDTIFLFHMYELIFHFIFFPMYCILILSNEYAIFKFVKFNIFFIMLKIKVNTGKHYSCMLNFLLYIDLTVKYNNCSNILCTTIPSYSIFSMRYSVM